MFFYQDPVIEMVSEGDFLDHLPPDWRDSLEPSVYTAKPDCQSSTAVRQGGEEVKEKNDDSAQVIHLQKQIRQIRCSPSYSDVL